MELRYRTERAMLMKFTLPFLAADLVPDLKSEVALIRIATQRDQIDEKGCPPSHGLSGIPKLAETFSPAWKTITGKIDANTYCNLSSL